MPTSKLDKPDLFFSNLRAGLLGPKLDNAEVKGCEAILHAVGEAGWPLSWAAYALATAYHETAHTMQPIKEFGGPRYFFRMYDPKGLRPQVAKKLGNTQAGDGARYFGRGYVQLTGRANYRHAEQKLGVALEANPDLALGPGVVLLRGETHHQRPGLRVDDREICAPVSGCAESRRLAMMVRA